MELYRVFQMEKEPLALCGYLFTIGYYIMLRVQPMIEATCNWYMLLFMGYLICVMVLFVAQYPSIQTNQMMAGFFGFFYVTVMLSYLYQIRRLEDGAYLVWLAFICSWGCDTSAYCVGMLCGKHKMAPKLSPKKSVEGAIGGVLGAALLGFLYACAIRAWGGVDVSGFQFAIIGAAAGAISQIGDLGASAIKRFQNIKDYGTLIPGHGGILDRFDSVIFTAPIIYYLCILL
jgi:phosphatidate cytidylyltransferase